MKLTEQKIPAEAVLNLINGRLEAVTRQYQYAAGNNRKIEAEAMAETKWQIAELKMLFCDLLIKSMIPPDQQKIEKDLHEAKRLLRALNLQNKDYFDPDFIVDCEKLLYGK